MTVVVAVRVALQAVDFGSLPCTLGQTFPRFNCSLKAVKLSTMFETILLYHCLIFLGKCCQRIQKQYNLLRQKSRQMLSDLAQYGPCDVGGDQANQEDRDEMPEKDQPRGGDGGIQEHLRGDQRLPLLNAPRAPNIFMFLQSCL